jgi:hypothetical protein
MSQKILISNLPPDVGTEQIARVLTEAGVEHLDVTLNNQGNPDKVTAVLTMGDIDRATADRIAAQINGTLYQGRTLHADVPLFM